MGCKCSLPPLPCSLPFPRRSTSVKALLVQGKFFKNYKIGEKLGEGAFGQVWEETVLDFIGLPSLFNDLRDYASPDLGTAGAEYMDFDYASPDLGMAGAD